MRSFSNVYLQFSTCIIYAKKWTYYYETINLCYCIHIIQGSYVHFIGGEHEGSKGSTQQTHDCIECLFLKKKIDAIISTTIYIVGLPRHHKFIFHIFTSVFHLCKQLHMPCNICANWIEGLGSRIKKGITF